MTTSWKQFALNYFSLFALSVLTLIGLWSSWNDGFLYARTQLPLLYNNHALSILGICIAAFWLWLEKGDPLPAAVFAVFGTASIHELLLDAEDLLFFHISSGVSLGYAAYLSGFLVIGFFLVRKYHKRVWLAQAGLMASYFFVLVVTQGGLTTIDPNVPFAAGKDFYSPLANMEEVGGWLALALLWFLPRKWFLSSPRSADPPSPQ